MGYYDVLTTDFKIIPLVLAMSEEDAMHIAEIKHGITAIDVSPSLDDDNIYK